MDMVFFPYNNMYSVDFTGNNTATTYSMKVNGGIIKITHQPYWKKDFLETSLNGYCKYMLHNKKVFLDDYLNSKFSYEPTRNILLRNLTPSKTTVAYWPRWYIAFAGYPITSNATMELWQYNFKYEGEEALITDSISIYKTILP